MVIRSAEDKEYRRRIRLGLAMAVGLAAVLIWGAANIGQWRKAFQPPDGLIVQTQLLHLAAAEKKYRDDRGRPPVGWADLAECGFLPDERVLMRVIVVDLDWGGGRLRGFMAVANHLSGSDVFYISDFDGREARRLSGVEPLKAPDGLVSVVGESPLKLSGPPFLVFMTPH